MTTSRRRVSPGAVARLSTAAAAAAAALAGVPTASADPPSNDDRANAAVLPTFPARASGTTAEATVERLDPQVSRCGRVEATVWYRLDAAPDGRIVVSVQAAAELAPVVRVYRRTTSAIQERACATAEAGARAVTSFETVRGAGYLILVGRRPGALDGAFDVTAELFLPPANDTPGGAAPLGRLPRTVNGSTLGATGGDVEGCGLVGGSVWYRLAAPASGRVAVRLAAAQDVDAAVAVFARVRSRLRPVGCARTDDEGRALVAFETRPRVTYLVAVGERLGSSPGTFTLRVLAGEPLERLSGRALPRRGVAATVEGLTDVNDVWAVALRAGTTYRVVFASPACARIELRAPGVGDRNAPPLLQLRCNGYAMFTPGPQGRGRYTLEVTAAPAAGRQRYAVRVARAGPDDVGLGRPLRDRTAVSGTLSPRAADVVDVYHFDVRHRSEGRLTLSARRGTQLDLVVVDDAGRRVGAGATAVRRRLERGRYVVAVRAGVGTPAGRYRLALHLRAVTATSVSVSGSRRLEALPGTTVAVAASVSPTPGGGVVRLQIDRFDPLTGWHFHRLRSVRPGGVLTWRPPAAGRWRIRAFFKGTANSSPSRSGYSYVDVGAPLAPGGR